MLHLTCFSFGCFVNDVTARITQTVCDAKHIVSVLSFFCFFFQFLVLLPFVKVLFYLWIRLCIHNLLHLIISCKSHWHLVIVRFELFSNKKGKINQRKAVECRRRQRFKGSLLVSLNVSYA